jgi:MoaA/NifB/PqqE/SkfB family radical SAM enzyme
MTSKSQCPLLFYHGHVRPDGKIYPCCYFNPKQLPEDLNINNKNWFNHPYLESVRNQVRQGKTVVECSKCYIDEISLNYSLRLEKIDFYQKKENKRFEIPTTAKLQSIDLAFSNLCNNKCRMCTPQLSTYWYPDAIKLNMPFDRGVKNIDDYIENTDFTSLVNAKIVGGEPMLEQDRIKKFLLKCNRSQLTLDIITNCTVKPDNELVVLLEQCAAVNWVLSIDAYGKLNDYLRKGSQWDTVVENLKYYTLTWKKVEVYSVISIYNVNCLDTLSNFITKNFPTVKFTFAMIDGPEWMTVKHIPESVKHILIDRLDYTTSSRVPQWKLLIKRQLTVQGDPELFLKFNQSLDRVRNETLAMVNPELAQWFEEYTNKGIN